MPRFTSVVDALPASVPFVGPEAQERLRERLFKARIGANESVFGPSPEAVAAMAAADVWKYADPENFELKAALAAFHGVAVANIVVGEGIDALLGYLVRLLVAPGTPVVTSHGAYPTFNFHVTGYGGRLEMVPYRDDFEDLEGLLARTQALDAPLVFVANPDNPMGSWHKPARVQGMIEALPDGCVLCLDEAYAEFAPGALAFDVSDPNVIRMRTFSKAYGMAGARVAYAIGHTGLISAFDKVRNHFAMNRAAVAGAMAALADGEWLAQVLGEVAGAKARIGAIAKATGLRALRSATNFVALDCGRDGIFARRVLNGLIARDVFVRMPLVAPQDRCIRVTAGTSGDLDLFEEMLPQALREAGNG